MIHKTLEHKSWPGEFLIISHRTLSTIYNTLNKSPTNFPSRSKGIKLRGDKKLREIWILECEKESQLFSAWEMTNYGCHTSSKTSQSISIWQTWRTGVNGSPCFHPYLCQTSSSRISTRAIQWWLKIEEWASSRFFHSTCHYTYNV